MNKILYIYESHTGANNFVVDHELTDEERYCPLCRETDELLYKGTKKEILRQLKRKIAFAKKRLEKAKATGITDEIINKEVDLENTELAYTTALDDLRYYLCEE